MSKEDNSEIDFGDLSEQAAILVQILGSVAIEREFNYTQKIVDEILEESGLQDEAKIINEKLVFLGVLPKSDLKGDNNG